MLCVSTIKDIYADPHADIDTRHHPLIAKIKIKRKKSTNQTEVKTKRLQYKQCSKIEYEQPPTEALEKIGKWN